MISSSLVLQVNNCVCIHHSTKKLLRAAAKQRTAWPHSTFISNMRSEAIDVPHTTVSRRLDEH